VLAELKKQLKKDREGREPCDDDEVSAAEEKLGDECQRKQAELLAKAAKRKQTGGGEAVPEAEVGAQMAKAPHPLRLQELNAPAAELPREADRRSCDAEGVQESPGHCTSDDADADAR